MKCNFYIGQKVVCINDRRFDKLDHRVYVGEIYTIRDIGDMPQYQKTFHPESGPDFIGVRLYEISRCARYADGSAIPNIEEPMYDYRRFKPLLDRKTDISVFTALLNDTNIPVTV